MARRRRWLVFTIIAGASLLGTIAIYHISGQDQVDVTRTVETVEKRNRQGRLLWTESVYKGEQGENIRHGPAVYWHRNGRQRSKQEYLDGKLNGLQIKWDSSGNKIEESSYRDNRRHGTWVQWHFNGKKSIECTYVNGRVDGKKSYWHANGSRAREELHDKDGFVVQTTAWHKNEKKSMQGTFSTSKKDGVWTYWNQDGDVIAMGTWKNGKPWNGVCILPASGDAGSLAGIQYAATFKDGVEIAGLRTSFD